MKKASFFILAAIFGLGVAAWGAEIKLKDGSVLQGEIVEKGKTKVKIKTNDGLELEIDGDMISEAGGEKYTVDVHEAYEEQLRSIDDSKAEDQFRIGSWCQSKGLRNEAKTHFTRAIEINPNHEGANLALDRVFVKDEGKWMDKYEAQKKGYTAARGTGEWVTEKEAMEMKGLKEYKGYMLSDSEIQAMKAREIKRFKDLYYTHNVCDLKGQIMRMDFLNKCNLDKKQLEQIFTFLLEAENKRQFFLEQRNAINARVEVAYNRLKEEGMKGVFNTYERPPGVEEAAGKAEYEIVDMKKGYVTQMSDLAERTMKFLAQAKGARTQKGSALFAMDHDYCMCCHSKEKMTENTECASCHRGGRTFESRPAELQALKDIRAMSGKDWAAQKDKIIKKWSKPIAGAEKLAKSELMRQEMEERMSIEKILVEARDQGATDFERNKEMMAAKLACPDAAKRTEIELDVLGARRHELSHNVKAMGMMVNCYFDGTLFDYVSKKLGKKADVLLASSGRGTGLVERQAVATGKASFEEYCGFCHPIERVMVRVRMGMGAEMWAEKVPVRMRYWKGAFSDQEWQQRVDAIVEYVVELENQYAEKNNKKKDEF